MDSGSNISHFTVSTRGSRFSVAGMVYRRQVTISRNGVSVSPYRAAVTRSLAVV